jgi:hypothetical protein
VSFGIFKFIVLPYVSELIEMWKSRRVMKDGTEKKFMINPLPQVPTPKSTVVEIPDQPRTPGSIITWERIFFKFLILFNYMHLVSSFCSVQANW